MTEEQSIPKHATKVDSKRNVEYVLVPANDKFRRTDPKPTVSMWDCFLEAAKEFAEKEVLGYREHNSDGTYSSYQWLTFNQVKSMVDTMGSALAAMGAKKSDKIGIFMISRVEWIISEYAITRQGCISVPLYATFGVEAITHTLNQAELSIIFITNDLLPVLIETIKAAAVKKLQLALRRIVCVCVPTLTEELSKVLKENSIELVTWEQAEELGKEKPIESEPPTHSDVFSIIYTSGTTGEAKGAIITHDCAVFGFRSVLGIPQLADVQNETYLSYLPLAHVFERRICIAFLFSGARVGMISGNFERLMDDLGTLKPTLIIGVPRVWKKVHDAVVNTIDKSNFLTRFMFNMAVGAKRNAYVNKSYTWVNWDSLVLKTLQDKLGGKIRLVVSGAAPMDAELSIWMKSAFNLEFYQGYGLTETYGAVCSQVNEDDPSTIGHLWPHVEGRIVSVPELEYLARGENPKGELQIRGISTFKGYFKNPDATKETISDDGWVATGDIVRLNNDDSLTIIDRKKNIFKLSQGEYIAVEYIENILGRTTGVLQIWVWGNSQKDYLVAVVVPNLESLSSTLAAMNIEPTMEAACASEALRKHLLDAIVKTGRDAKLSGFQCPRAIFLEKEPFSEDNGFLTPSFKLKRNILQQKYSDTLNKLYEK